MQPCLFRLFLKNVWVYCLIMKASSAFGARNTAGFTYVLGVRLPVVEQMYRNIALVMKNKNAGLAVCNFSRGAYNGQVSRAILLQCEYLERLGGACPGLYHDSISKIRAKVSCIATLTELLGYNQSHPIGPLLTLHLIRNKNRISLIASSRLTSIIPCIM